MLLCVSGLGVFLSCLRIRLGRCIGKDGEMEGRIGSGGGVVSEE